MDRAKVTDRQGVFLLSAAARSLGHDPKELVLNRESSRRDRARFRAVAAAEIKASFQPDVPLTVHWDGKIVPAADGSPAEDRLPVLVSGESVSKLLAVPSLPNGTGCAMAEAVLSALEDWDIKGRICALSFDTTASNTGLSRGACSIIEQKLEKTVLHLACRHHIHELVCEKAFTACLGPSTGPDILLFKRFAAQWDLIDQTRPKPFSDENMPQHLKDARDGLLIEFSCLLEGQHQRDDYRELLELSAAVLGGPTKHAARFRRPGAFHRARWMGKILYAIKLFLFREQFQMSSAEVAGIRRFVVFAVSVYVTAWYKAPLPAKAPAADLALLNALVCYPDSAVAKATSAVFARHLWYLSERLVSLAIFDEGVDLATKREMTTAMEEEEGSEDPPRRVSVDLSTASVSNKSLVEFTTTTSKEFFEILDINTAFLLKDPEEWITDRNFIAASRRVQALQVVNDFAERGVALMQSFNLALTKSEDQRQFLLQVVAKHRCEFPTASKCTVTSK